MNVQCTRHGNAWLRQQGGGLAYCGTKPTPGQQSTKFLAQSSVQSLPDPWPSNKKASSGILDDVGQTHDMSSSNYFILHEGNMRVTWGYEGIPSLAVKTI
eukprot:scpid100518/ scgid8295/ 